MGPQRASLFLLIWIAWTGIAAGGSDYAATVVADNPIAYWRLGESTPSSTAIDETSTHNGTFGTNVGLGSPGALTTDTDSAATFTGFASSKVTVGPQATLTPQTFTIELWARPTAPPGAGRSPAAYRDLVGPSNASGWQIAVNAAGNWEFRTGKGNVGSGDPWNTIEGPVAVQNQWSYIVGTYDGNDMRFYVDGAPVGERVGVPYLPVDSFFFFINLFIGASRTEDVSGTGDLFWIGDIDEVAYYPSALSLARIQEHLAAANGSVGPTLETLTSVDRIGADVVFAWNTESGASYRLRRSADLDSWNDVAPPIGGTGGEVSQSDSVTAGGSLEFYRVEID